MSHIFKKISLALLCAIAVLTVGCTDDPSVETVLGCDDNTLVLQPEVGTVRIIVRSNSSWSVVSQPEQWFSFNVVEGKDDGAVTVRYTENKTDLLREATVSIKADGKVQDVVLKQMGRTPLIVVNGGVEQMTVSPSKSVKTAVPLLINVPLDVVQLTFQPLEGDQSHWIGDLKLETGNLTFSVAANSVGERKGKIVLYYKDQFDRQATDELIVSQAFNQYADAVMTNFGAVRAMGLGTITDNVMISGVIISDGRNGNFMTDTKTLTIQSEEIANGAILFELASDRDNSFARYDKVELALKDGIIVERTDDNLLDPTIKNTYRVITGITATHIQAKQSSTSFAMPKIYMDEIADNMQFCMVELRDVEFSVPFGSLTNWHEGYIKNASNVDCFKAFPHSIRDIKGNHMRLLTNPTCSYRRDGTELPQGSGSLRGIIVRENVSAYSVTSNEYSIRHLERSDIDLKSSRTEGFSQVLVEWDGEFPYPKTNIKDPASKELIDQYSAAKSMAPTIGTGKLFHNTAKKFGLSWADNNSDIYFATNYSGLTTTSYSYARGALNYGRWQKDTSWWIISDVSTAAVPAQSIVSLQIEVNSNNDGPRDFAAEYSIDGQATWKRLGEYRCSGQLSAAPYNTVDYMPGYNVYDFKLPADAAGVSNLAVRLICISSISVRGTEFDVVNPKGTGAGTTRLGHVSIKYNK